MGSGWDCLEWPPLAPSSLILTTLFPPRKERMAATHLISLRKVTGDLYAVRENPLKIKEIIEEHPGGGHTFRSDLCDFVRLGYTRFRTSPRAKPGSHFGIHSHLTWFTIADRVPARATREYLLRTIAYSVVAEHERLIYYPDYRRIPMVLSIARRLSRSIPREAYDRLAKAPRD